MTDDLVQWLTVQLDEDERIARRVTTPDTWRVGRSHGGSTIEGDGWTVGSADELDAAHIATHDPARVLREIDAKRQIVALHGLVHRDISWLEDGEEESAELAVCSNCVPRHAAYSHRHDMPAGSCATVRLLALPYADRPGYRDEWRP